MKKPRFASHLVWMTCVFVLLLVLLPVACFREEAKEKVKFDSKLDIPKEEGPSFYVDITAETGVDHTYHNGEEAGHRAILESLGGGVALFDFDGDGLLDIYLPGGGHFKDKEILGYPGKLYRNLGNWKFKDVTDETGLSGPLFYTHGALAFDYDNDGWLDLLVSGWGGVVLYHNVANSKGGRTFVDVTEEAGLKKGWNWATSAAAADLDGDGYPEIYVCQYGDWSFKNHPLDCKYNLKDVDICPPKKFKCLQHRLFRNNRNGTFTDVTDEPIVLQNGKQVGLRRGSQGGKGLAVIMLDVNGDGKPDIYVANDTDDKIFYLNKSTPGHLLLADQGQAAGVTGDVNGSPNGSMGLDAADDTHRGKPSLWVTNYENELNALFRNYSEGGEVNFQHETQKSGIAVMGNAYVGWGTRFVDLDLDGWEDIMVSNGHVILHPPTRSPRKQLPVLLHNQKEGKYLIYKPQGESYFTQPHNARGVALGDLNNVGRQDLVISHVNEPVAVLRHVLDNSNHFLGVDLRGKGNRDVVGATLVLQRAGGQQTMFTRGGGSYASTSDRRLVFGMGSDTEAVSIEVHWPWGSVQTWKNLKADCRWILKEQQPEAEQAQKP